MPFCTNCGKQFPVDAKFCPECGTPAVGAQSQGQRKQEYAGELKKCPNCGEILSAFEAICHSCGYELRNSKAAEAVQALSDTIAKLESDRRKYERKSQNVGEIDITPGDKSIANVIQNFAIPNNKEDILEFFILAANSLDATALYRFQIDETSESLIARAWYSKFEQSYQKAKLVFGNGADFDIVKEIYDKKQVELLERKKKRNISRMVLFVFFLILGVLLLFLLLIGPLTLILS